MFGSFRGEIEIRGRNASLLAKERKGETSDSSNARPAWGLWCKWDCTFVSWVSARRFGVTERW